MMNSEERIKELEERCTRYEAVISGTGEMFFEYSRHTDTLTIFFSMSDGSIVMLDVNEFVVNFDNNIYIYNEDKHLFHDMRAKGITEKNHFDIRMRVKSDYEFEWYRVTVKPDRREGYFAGSARNINEEKLEEERLKEKAFIDPLSKVYNRATAVEKIEEALAVRASDRECALIVLDIDNFKNINDTYGHIYGDAVIAMVAGGIKSTLDPKDIMGRFGGDEFFAFIDNAEKEALERKVEAIRLAVFKMRVDAEDENDISCSIGVATGKGGDEYEELFRKADSALYKAKENGKNRFEYFDGTYSSEEALSYAGVLDEDESNVAHNITAMALEIASKSTTAVNAVSNIMRHIGMALELDCIQIMEFDTLEDKVYLGFQWWRESNGAYNVVYTEKKMGYYVHNDLMLFKKRFAKDKIFQYTPDFKEGFSQKYRDVFELSEHVSLVYASNTENENVFYAVTFQSWKKDRVWQQSEFDDMFGVTKILSMYLKTSYDTTEREKMLMKRLDYYNGLYTLQKFYEEAGRIGIEARAHEEQLCVVNIDVKDMYKINTTYGGDIGDKVLKSIREMLKKTDRKQAIACQTQGTDEFILLFRTKQKDSLADVMTKELERMCTEFAEYTDPPIIIKAGMSFFKPGVYISDYIDAARAVKKTKNFTKSECIVAKEVPTAYKNPSWRMKISEY